MSSQINVNIKQLTNPVFTLVYQLPLMPATQAWITDDFDRLVRKYASLSISKVNIISITIKGELPDAK